MAESFWKSLIGMFRSPDDQFRDTRDFTQPDAPSVISPRLPPSPRQSRKNLILAMWDGFIAKTFHLKQTSEEELIFLEVKVAADIELVWARRIDKAFSETLDKWKEGPTGKIRPITSDIVAVNQALVRNIQGFTDEIRPIVLDAMREAFFLGTGTGLLILLGMRTDGVVLAKAIDPAFDIEAINPDEDIHPVARKKIEETKRLPKGFVLAASFRLGGLLGVTVSALRAKALDVETGERGSGTVGAVQNVAITRSAKALLEKIEANTLEALTAAELSLISGTTPEAMTEATLFFNNKHFPARVRPDTMDWMQRNLVTPGGGFTRAEFLPLRADLRGRLDETFQWRASAGTNLNRSMNYGFIEVFAEHRVSAYRIVAIIDDRTTTICINLNGRVFPIEAGISISQKVNGLLASGDWGALADTTPFLSAEEVIGMSGAQLSGRGVSLPPFHVLCRTSVEPVSFFLQEERTVA